MIRTLKFLAMAVVAIITFTGCAPQFMRMPPPSITADPNGRVRVTYPNPAQGAARIVHDAFGPTLYERTRNGGTEISDGWIEFMSDQRRAEFIVDPGGVVGECFVKYKSTIVVRGLRAPNWNFVLRNYFDSSTREFEVWFRYEDGAENMLMTITVVSSPPASLQPRRGR